MKELIIDAVTENLDPILDFIGESLEAEDCPMKLQTQINIAAEEVFVNIAHYAYKPEVGPVTLRVMVENGEVSIAFEDGGVPYNPLENSDPDINASAEERQIGGLGIFMVKNIMDSVDYRHENGKNILTIKKNLP